VPGISEALAKELVAKGFRDFSDVVRLALPARAVEQGLHHAIARKAMLADLVVRPGRNVSGARCPMCGAAWLVNATRCAACGSSVGEDLDPPIPPHNPAHTPAAPPAPPPPPPLPPPQPREGGAL